MPDAPDFHVIASGTVTGPPDLQPILEKIAKYAEVKQELTLTPGELRVLTLHLEENR